MLNLIDGKKLSEELLLECKTRIDSLRMNYRKPSLAVITVGDDEASKVYVRNKKLACEKCGMNFINEVFKEDVPRETVISRIKDLNVNTEIDGILIHFPVPEALNGVEQEINIKKDVDGFNIYNLGNSLYSNSDDFKIEACTPFGIMYMLEKYNIDLQGKHVVILGRSTIVGKPLIGSLLARNATVTSCNSYTQDMREITKTADIIISAIGKPKFIDDTYISEKTDVIIDVGMNRDENGKLCGDVDFNKISKVFEASSKNKYITPVPGGVGPMTVAALIHNLAICYENNIKQLI